MKTTDAVITECFYRESGVSELSIIETLDSCLRRNDKLHSDHAQ